MPQEGRAGEEKTLETVVWETPVSRGEGAQGRPAGAVVEVVERVDEVAVRPGGQVRAGECAHAHLRSRQSRDLPSGLPSSVPSVHGLPGRPAVRQTMWHVMSAPARTRYAGAMGEIENRPPDPSMLRISDNDRQKVAEVLREAAGEGRIDLEELDERLELTWGAKTYADLVPITADLQLPAHPQPARAPAPRPSYVPAMGHASSTAIMGECKRQGVWPVPEHHSAFALMGSVLIDLRQAQLAATRHPDQRQHHHGRGQDHRPGPHPRRDRRDADHGRVRPRQGQGPGRGGSGLTDRPGARNGHDGIGDRAAPARTRDAEEVPRHLLTLRPSAEQRDPVADSAPATSTSARC